VNAFGQADVSLHQLVSPVESRRFRTNAAELLSQSIDTS
jgi:hypothetical protein